MCRRKTAWIIVLSAMTLFPLTASALGEPALRIRAQGIKVSPEVAHWAAAAAVVGAQHITQLHPRPRKVANAHDKGHKVTRTLERKLANVLCRLENHGVIGWENVSRTPGVFEKTLAGGQRKTMAAILYHANRAVLHFQVAQLIGGRKPSVVETNAKGLLESMYHLIGNAAMLPQMEGSVPTTGGFFGTDLVAAAEKSVTRLKENGFELDEMGHKELSNAGEAVRSIAEQIISKVYRAPATTKFPVIE